MRCNCQPLAVKNSQKFARSFIHFFVRFISNALQLLLLEHEIVTVKLFFLAVLNAKFGIIYTISNNAENAREKMIFFWTHFSHPVDVVSHERKHGYTGSQDNTFRHSSYPPVACRKSILGSDTFVG